MHLQATGEIFYSSCYLFLLPLFLFTVLPVHLTLRISPHHSPSLDSHRLSLHQPFTPDLKPICSTDLSSEVPSQFGFGPDWCFY